MQTKEAIRFALTLSNKAVLSAIDEMSDAPTTFPTAKGGCHPLWVLGHLTVVEGLVPQVLFGNGTPPESWAGPFLEHSEAVSDAAAYPPFAEVRERYVRAREANLKLLDSLTEEDLDKPTQAPPKGRETEFATYGLTFLTLALHQTMHRAHVMDARRSLGRKDLAVTPRAA